MIVLFQHILPEGNGDADVLTKEFISRIWFSETPILSCNVMKLVFIFLGAEFIIHLQNLEASGPSNILPLSPLTRPYQCRDHSLI